MEGSLRHGDGAFYSSEVYELFRFKGIGHACRVIKLIEQIVNEQERNE